MTASDPTAPATADPARVLGAAAVLEVCLRGALILCAVAVVALVVLAATLSPGGFEVQTALAIVALAYGFHLVALAVLGWPGGMLTAHLLRHQTSERRHVAAFALTGALLGAAVLLVWGGGVAVATWAILGAATAGSARAWTGHARRARAARRASHPVDLA